MNNGVYALAVLPNGDLVAGGEFTTAGGVAASRIARWDGSTWSALGSGTSGTWGPSGNTSGVFTLAVAPNGDVLAGGIFTTAGGVVANHIARWNGSTWSALGTGLSSNGYLFVHSLAVLPNSDVLVGGTFTTAGGIPAIGLARWDGSAWSAWGSQMGEWVRAMMVLPNGDLVAGGQFWSAGGIPMNHIALWNGSAWSALGSGTIVTSSLYSVEALTPLPNGDLIAGGNFTSAGGVAATRIARWDGSTWTALGTGMNNRVSALAVLPNGDLVAGGEFTTAGGIQANRIARWDGNSWSALGSGMNSRVDDLALMPNGDHIAGGFFTTAGGVPTQRIARWDGSSWSALGVGLYISTRALAVLPNGDLVAGGQLTSAGGAPVNGIARWDGATWSALGSGVSGYVSALAMLPNGDLVAGGSFITAGGIAANNIARWDGTTWSALGSGTNEQIRSLAVQPDGQLFLGGEFTIAGGQVSAHIARYATPCVASVTLSGAACASSGGANTYAALTRPWTGSTYRTQGTGLPALAIVAVVHGFTGAAIPLASLLPPAPAGCTLWAAPDVVDATLAIGGTVDVQLGLPNTPSLSGLILHQQLVALEFDAGGSFVQTTSTNGLVATVGTF